MTLTLKSFKTDAGSMKVELGGATVEVQPREFSTGSFGWYAVLQCEAPEPGMFVDQFLKSAKPLVVNVGGNLIACLPRQHGTGSIGYRCDQAIESSIRLAPVKVQVTITVTFVGSKGAVPNSVLGHKLQCSVQAVISGSKKMPRGDEDEKAAAAASAALGKPVAKKGKKAKAPKATPGVAAGSSSSNDAQSA